MKLDRLALYCLTVYCLIKASAVYVLFPSIVNRIVKFVEPLPPPPVVFVADSTLPYVLWTMALVCVGLCFMPKLQSNTRWAFFIVIFFAGMLADLLIWVAVFGSVGLMH